MICDDCKEKKYYFGDMDLVDYCEICQEKLKCVVCNIAGDLLCCDGVLVHKGICKANLDTYPERYN